MIEGRKENRLTLSLRSLGITCSPRLLWSVWLLSGYAQINGQHRVSSPCQGTGGRCSVFQCPGAQRGVPAWLGAGTWQSQAAPKMKALPCGCSSPCCSFWLSVVDTSTGTAVPAGGKSSLSTSATANGLQNTLFLFFSQML